MNLRLLFLIPACALSILACNTSAPKTKPLEAAPTQVSNIANNGAPTKPDTDIAALVGIAALAGTWNAVIEVKGYGVALGSLNLDSQGHGFYLVHMSGQVRKGQMTVHSWDGQWIQASALGHKRRVAATLKGNLLTLELPALGTITIEREPPNKKSVFTNNRE